MVSWRKNVKTKRAPGVPLGSVRVVLGATATLVLALTSTAAAQHRVLIQGRNRLAILDAHGAEQWQMPWGTIHDVHVLANGRILVQQGPSRIAEIEPATRSVTWTYDSAVSNRNEGKVVEVHAFQPLADGCVMIAESGIGRIIEVNRDGKLLKQIKLEVTRPHPHTDTRLARKLDNGHYLVCHEGDGMVREYDGDGHVVWRYEVPMFGRAPAGGHGPEAFGNKVFSAVRLASGNTLIGTGNGHSVLEVSPDGQIVWSLHQNDLPGIILAWVTTLDVLPNGRYLIGNCHAGPQNPVLVEIDPSTKRVTWTLDAHARFGNDVSNTRILDASIPLLR